MYDIDEGEILINEKNIKGLSTINPKESDRLYTAGYFSFQWYGGGKYSIWVYLYASKEEVYEKAEIAGVHNEILKFAEGYKTLVGREGRYA